MIALAVALPAFFFTLHTQAEITAPVPALKPEFASVPVPATKPINESLLGQNDQPAEIAPSIAQVAMVVPRQKPMRKAGIETSDQGHIRPNRVDPLDPISKGQAEIYARIFAFQSQGQIMKADKEIRNLRDERLLGHVLYQRYMHPTAYKTSFEELKYWLDLYADHPGASRIYKMAMARKPKHFSGEVRKPVKLSGIGIVREPTVDRAKRYKSETVTRNAAQRASVRQLQSELNRHIRKGAPTNALKVLNTHAARKYLDQNEKNILKASVIAGYFYAGKLDKAYSLAKDVVAQSGEKAPKAAWVAGLISWKKKDYDKAARYFAICADSEYASGWDSAASAFWAARANMRSGNVKEISKWLHVAYEHPRTFYGLLAARALGKDYQFNWKMPTFTREYFKLLNSTPQGRRALALVSAGQNHLAEIELTRIDAEKDKKLYTALLAYADFAALPSLAYRLGSYVSDAGSNKFYDTALYPTGPWEPSSGYQIDPALIHAIMRQESRFNPYAGNASGATGLMQLMPSTASYITGENYKGAGRHKLLDPQLNLDIGQLYIKRLVNNNLVGGDIIKLLVAYNAGPGNLQKWEREIGKDVDPLTFIEMIPVAETRAYVEHVLSNYWIYRLRDKKQTESLDVLAQGQWPSYLELRAMEEYKIAYQP